MPEIVLMRCERLSANITKAACEANRARKENLQRGITIIRACQDCPGIESTDQGVIEMEKPAPKKRAAKAPKKPVSAVKAIVSGDQVHASKVGDPVRGVSVLAQARNFLQDMNNGCGFEIVPGYECLAQVLQAALDQAQYGKGKERHANSKPFDQQPIMQIGRMVGSGFNAGQAIKKAQESMRLSPAHARSEFLDAINYLASAYLLSLESEQ